MKLPMVLLHSLLNFLPLINAARILAISPSTAISRYNFAEAIMRSLHAAGHQITLISGVAPSNEIDNFTVVNSRSKMPVFQSKIDESAGRGISTFMDVALARMEQHCSNVIELPVIQDALNSTKNSYDVLFVDMLAMYRCYLPIAEKLDIPVIGTVTTVSWSFVETDMGYPNQPSAVPMKFFGFKSSMTFIQRLKNVWGRLLMLYYVYFRMPASVDRLARKHFPEAESPLNNKVSLVFYNSHVSLLPRPLVPNMIEVGGIHVKSAKPLPQDLQEFIDGAENGVILFTFGTILNASTMPIEMQTAFVNAFAAIPQRVIWKFENSTLGISDNVLLSNWVPQRDILEHKNVKAFISHCGLGGVYEAIYTATPLIMIPLIFDQNSNAAHLEELGVGIHLKLNAISTEKVLNALNLIVNDTGYYERMQNVSRWVKERPMTPQQSAVYWTEYVIRHNGAPHLHSVANGMPLYQYFLLDILFSLVVLITVSWYLIRVWKKLHKICIDTSKFVNWSKKKTA